ncbi:MAG: methyltransferase domain-containing protein [Chloroflexota bacterium]
MRAQWPIYLFGYGGGIVLLIAVIVISVAQGWYSFVLLALVGLMVLAYFLGVSLWAYHALHDNHSIRDALYEMGELAPTMTVVDINLGLREFPVALSRRMTTGKVIVLDVYNPLLAPKRTRARAHDSAVRPVSDPRLFWRDGNINLLPLPDDSVQAVTLVQVASELWQEGDRLRLLEEINRVLQPGGCLLMAERVQTSINLLVSGPAGLRLAPSGYWLELLERGDFKIRQSKSIRDLILCLRVDKRQVGEARPLPVDL